MGYESKLIVVERTEIWNGIVVGEAVAEFNLCVVNCNFTDIFTEPIDFNLYIDGNPTMSDCYGKHCCMADVDDVIKALEKMSEEIDYRRFAPAIGLLKGFEQQRWDTLKVVHYGY